MKQIIVGTLFVCSLFGQNAEISGIVRDASGAVIPAAKVSVINQDTATDRATTARQLWSLFGSRASARPLSDDGVSRWIRNRVP